MCSSAPPCLHPRLQPLWLNRWSKGKLGEGRNWINENLTEWRGINRIAFYDCKTCSLHSLGQEVFHRKDSWGLQLCGLLAVQSRASTKFKSSSSSFPNCKWRQMQVFLKADVGLNKYPMAKVFLYREASKNSRMILCSKLILFIFFSFQCQVHYCTCMQCTL